MEFCQTKLSLLKGILENEFSFSFEKLDFWHMTRKLVVNIYDLTKKFPADEKYGIISQLRRAAISIASNIAEGASRKSYKDMARFTQIAYGSAIELYNQLILSLDLKYLSEMEFKNLRLQVKLITNKLNSLYNYQLNKSTN